MSNTIPLIGFLAIAFSSGFSSAYLFGREFKRTKGRPDTAILLMQLFAIFAPAIYAIGTIDLASFHVNPFRNWESNLIFGLSIFVAAFMGIGSVDFQKFSPKLLAHAPLSVVWAIADEIAWRGYCTMSLAKTFSPTLAILISAVLWTSWRLPELIFFNRNQKQIAITVLISIIFGSFLGWLQLSTQTLLFPIVAHATFRMVSQATPLSSQNKWVSAGIGLTFLLYVLIKLPVGTN